MDAVMLAVCAKTADRRTRQFNVLELPHLYVYRPPGGVWPDKLRRLVDEIPHSCVMVSETQVPPRVHRTPPPAHLEPAHACIATSPPGLCSHQPGAPAMAAGRRSRCSCPT